MDQLDEVARRGGRVGEGGAVAVCDPARVDGAALVVLRRRRVARRRRRGRGSRRAARRPRGGAGERPPEHYPEEFKRRQDDKLAYRYPRGESYLDMIHRLDTMVHEMERHREPLLIVAHQGILRLLYAYLMGLSREEAPYVSIPLNTVIRLQPKTYSCDEERFLLIAKPKKSDGQDEPAVARDDDPPSH